MRNLMSATATAFDRYKDIIDGEIELTCHVYDREFHMINDGKNITVTVEDAIFIFTKNKYGWRMK